MRRAILGLTMAFLVSVALPTFAEVKTISGEVVDSVCVVKDANKHGESHAACAMACAKKGNQMAILTSDGVYNIVGDYATNNNAKLLDYVAKDVQAKGEVSQKDGKWQIDVSSMQAASHH
jgi:hypothetical protein